MSEGARSWLAVAGVAGMVSLAVIGGGALLGRPDAAGPAVSSAPADSPALPVPAGSPEPEPAPEPDRDPELDRDPEPDRDPGPEPEPDQGLAPAPESAQEPAAEPAPERDRSVAQPLTGPGQPPLSMTGSGPFGSHHTTGYEFAALTFDDGPDPQWTPQVLALLAEYGVTATFCVVGRQAAAYPELVAEIDAAGHTLCNHSWDHDLRLGNRPTAEIRADLVRTNEAILAAAPDARISYYRQPGGVWTGRVVQVAAELGMSSLHWTVDPRDWDSTSADQIVQTVGPAVSAGAIVLLHDGGGDRQDTVEALGRLLAELAGQITLAALPSGGTARAESAGPDSGSAR